MDTSLLDKKRSPLLEQVEELEPLVARLKGSPFLVDKLAALEEFFSPLLEGLAGEQELVVRSLIAIRQADRVFIPFDKIKFLKFVDILVPVEKFYAEVGGIVGYHWMMLKFLADSSACEEKNSIYHSPEGIDISKEDIDIRQAIVSGISNLGKMGEIYPVGGAADRLRLQDEKTGLPLPAARLLFCGKTLLEGMVADLQAREYLHYKLFGAQLVTPVAMMTSNEKDNHAQILSICEESEWFGRPKESFRFFSQPSVPTINKRGEWCLQEPMQLLLKPGGHGVIWKLARDEGIFDWFFEQGRKKGLVRQINNPIAGTDYGLLAFSGLGCMQDKSFGFASCPRQVKASEGVNVLIEKEDEFVLTNIEYCDFKKFNITDEAVKTGSPYSKFPSNTNILFIDFNAVLEAVAACPIPGMLVNMKKATYRSESGVREEEEIARLESMMQNIADFFGAPEKEKLKSYLTYNERRKTISCTKREFVLGSALLETPEGAVLDLLHNTQDLLSNKCGMEIPPVNDPVSFYTQGPSFICFYHPALGPLYSIIAQKVRGGKLRPGSELQMEIAELDMEGLDLSGSLIIRAKDLLGEREKEGMIRYSENSGKCTLKNVAVRNLGIDTEAPNVFWRNEIARKEACEIIICGNGEFIAENIVVEGPFRIEVEKGTRVRAAMKDGELVLLKEELESPSWSWKYLLQQDYHICLKKIASP